MAVDDDDCGATKFFKIILEPRNDLQKLGIPPKFMTDYGSDLVNVISLEIPTGKRWKVELHRENERAWFRQGWTEFVKYNTICHGHFLMFSYQGKSRFKVFIFDMTACEIDYPFVSEKTGEKLQKTVSEVPEKTSEKIRKTVSETKISKDNFCSPSSSSQEKGMVDLVRQYRMKQGNLTKTDINKINARQFKIPAFAIIIKSTFMHANLATIPYGFISHYLKKTKCSCIIKNATRKKWRLDISSYRPRITRFQKGWRKFARENNLQVGDICVFELIDAAKYVFKVEIARCSSGVHDTYARSVKTEEDVSSDEV